MNIVINGALMAFYLFIIVTCYIFLSGPFNDMVSSFETSDVGSSGPKVDEASGIARTVFNMIFACLILAPIVWFIVWCFRKEPGEEYYRRF